MPSHFDLIITADYPGRTAELRLLDEHGVQLAYRQTDFKTIAVSHKQDLFDLRDFLHNYVEEGKEAASGAEIGGCIGAAVPGAGTFRTLFEREIYPQRRIVADFLTHGVTRQRLQAQIQENGGYHIVHWSGHGHLNLLELAKPGGAQDYLSGEDLLNLFIEAGGFIPR